MIHCDGGEWHYNTRLWHEVGGMGHPIIRKWRVAYAALRSSASQLKIRLDIRLWFIQSRTGLRISSSSQISLDRAKTYSPDSFSPFPVLQFNE
jgi:hypothetical protein